MGFGWASLVLHVLRVELVNWLSSMLDLVALILKTRGGVMMTQCVVTRFVASIRIWALAEGPGSVVEIEWRLWCRCRRTGRWHFRQSLSSVIVRSWALVAGLNWMQMSNCV